MCDPLEISLLHSFLTKYLLLWTKGYLSPIQATVRTLVRVGSGGRDRFVRDNELESDDRLPLVSRSNPVAATFEKEKLSPTTPASERIMLA